MTRKYWLKNDFSYVSGFTCPKCKEPAGVLSSDFICRRCGYLDMDRKEKFRREDNEKKPNCKR